MSFSKHQTDTIKSAVRRSFGVKYTKIRKEKSSTMQFELGKRQKSTITYTKSVDGEIKVELGLRLSNCNVKSVVDYLALIDSKRGIVVYEYPMSIESQCSVIQGLLATII